jgi:hypothetical protein
MLKTFEVEIALHPWEKLNCAMIFFSILTEGDFLGH